LSSADERGVRAAKNQSLFREINERIEGLNENFGAIRLSAEWMCECADLACMERLEFSLDDYEQIRGHAERFPVKPGHEITEVERVVERHNGYLVVEKTGVGAEVARLRDPRA
jgi:hypothetical protein